MVLGGPSRSEPCLSPSDSNLTHASMFLSLSRAALLAIPSRDRLIPSHLHGGLTCYSPLLPPFSLLYSLPLSPLSAPSWPLLLTEGLCP